MKSFLFTLLLTTMLISCSPDECREYSKYTCKELDNAKYNVLFYFPDSEKEYNLGLTKGLDNCGEIAHSFADEKELPKHSKWGYVCCLKTEDSECEEMHR